MLLLKKRRWSFCTILTISATFGTYSSEISSPFFRIINDFAESLYLCEKNVEMQIPDPSKKNNSKLKTWFKRVGIGGLIFFTLKGIVWLIIFYFGAEVFQECVGI